MRHSGWQARGIESQHNLLGRHQHGRCPTRNQPGATRRSDPASSSTSGREPSHSAASGSATGSISDHMVFECACLLARIRSRSTIGEQIRLGVPVRRGAHPCAREVGRAESGEPCSRLPATQASWRARTARILLIVEIGEDRDTDAPSILERNPRDGLSARPDGERQSRLHHGRRARRSGSCALGLLPSTCRARRPRGHCRRPHRRTARRPRPRAATCRRGGTLRPLRRGCSAVRSPSGTAGRVHASRCRTTVLRRGRSQVSACRSTCER